MPPLAPMTHIYAADILKYEETAAGLMVHGKATGPDLDLDGQGCDSDWLKAAMPAWMKWGNVREMHRPVAAGVGKVLSEDGKDWLLDSLVVDEQAATKVREGVYKGYSIGIKNARLIKDPRFPNGRIVGGEIVEVSLVDRPANPTATIELAKAHGAELAPVTMAGEVIAKFAEDPEIPEEPDETEGEAAEESTDVDEAVDNEPETDGADEAEVQEDAPKAVSMSVSAYRAAAKLVGKLTALNKAAVNDESGDIAGAQAAISQICDLIISEASELKTGRMEELGDIELLCNAANSLRYFIRCEQREDGQLNPGADDSDDSIAYMGLGADVDVAKRQFSQKQRDAAAKSGAAMPDGSFPIKNEADLKNAIRAVGRAKDPDAAKAHIKARAKALGLTSLLPDSWTGESKGADVDLTKRVSDDQSEHDTAKLITQLTEVTKAQEAELATLRAEVTKVLDKPVAGGPMITNALPTPRAQVAVKAADPRSTPEYWERQAALTGLFDVKQAYMAKAAEVRKAQATSA